MVKLVRSFFVFYVEKSKELDLGLFKSVVEGAEVKRMQSDEDDASPGSN